MNVAALFRFMLGLGLSLTATAPAPAAAAGSAGQGAASARDVRAPTAGWVVDFADAQCVASRNYGTEREPLTLALKAPLAGEVMQVAVIRNGRGGRYAQQLSATLTVDGRPLPATTMLGMTTRRADQRLYRANLPLEQFNAVRRAQTLTIEAGGTLRESFALSDMASVLRVMDECVADLRRAWNAPQGETPSPALRGRAGGSLSGIFRPEDYPGIAAERDASGTVGFVILVDETGRVADCTVTQSSGVALLDAQSCAVIMQRVRYQPAIGTDGRPARDVIEAQVSWRLE